MYTNNIEKNWSQPIYVDIDGIDPSFFWENNRTFVQFTNWGQINQVEIDLENGQIKNGPIELTKGCFGCNTEATLYPGIQNNTIDYKMDFSKKSLDLQIVGLRKRHDQQIEYFKDNIVIKVLKTTLDENSSPMILGLRQREFEFESYVDIEFLPKNTNEEAGITLMHDNNHHVSLFLSIRDKIPKLVLRKKVVDIISENSFEIDVPNELRLKIKGTSEDYFFSYCYLKKSNEINFTSIGSTKTKHFSVESTMSANTGVILGPYIIGESCMKLSNFIIQ
jgi:beta-xylosidase